MAKAKSKKNKKVQRRPNIPAESTLRPRMDKFLRDETILQQDEMSIYNRLDEMSHNVKLDTFLTVLMTAYLDAPDSVQTYLEQVIPAWLSEREHTEVLESLVTKKSLDSGEEMQACAWLEACGSSIEDLDIPTALDYFYKCYYHGNEYQATIKFFWYANSQCNRVRGVGLLIDGNPPWDGSIKEVIMIPSYSPEALQSDFLDHWQLRGMPLMEISVEEGKDILIDALECNRKAGIRLGSDVAACRELFIRYILPLPQWKETVLFTIEDFDYLTQNGQRAEDIVHYEQTVGRRVRTQDGKEIVVVGDPSDFDF